MTSNAAESGEGQAELDWNVTGDLTLQLRAERSGSGDRVYTIALACTDAAGNQSIGNVTVSVPHDQRGR